MENLRVNKSKLVTVTNYAKKEGVTRQAIYARAEAGTVKITEIDGVKFVEKE